VPYFPNGLQTNEAPDKEQIKTFVNDFATAIVIDIGIDIELCSCLLTVLQRKPDEFR